MTMCVVDRVEGASHFGGFSVSLKGTLQGRF